ncbi:hypothetical protein G9C85_03690 [Halorubellus sp. JP-L1]|uniref:hypothetical protein n=1 Tax=Halorubellus sp. JP-L1 TaxID=2715753 RepID=UPI001409C895|nr:hypothetical protein [Halorubellus sp. JP-L1]NHN40739.1 hypothetical protein [Halorubellus sp. JP-L1]
MPPCAACGADVDGDGTYCTACANDASDGREAVPPVATPLHRAVAAFLAVATLLGAFSLLRSLTYLPTIAEHFGGVDVVGFVATRVVLVGFPVAYAVMAKRLYDGTARAGTYGRVLQVVAGLSVASGVLVTVLPDALTHWLPTVQGPGHIVLSTTRFYLARTAFATDWQVLALGVAGAIVTFAAGTALVRDP